MYSATLLEHFANPRYAGELKAATVKAEVQNPACGDVLELSLRIEDGVIAEVRFRAKGCVPCVACGSALTDMVAGTSVSEALLLTERELIASLDGVPATSSHAAALAIDALRKALLGEQKK